MLLQISSGQGPVECSIGVQKLTQALLKEFSRSRLISVNHDYSGNGYKSAVMEFDDDISFMEGTILWICKSPIRPEHKRKNWFMDLSVIKEVSQAQELKESDIRIETMHCGGKGGQHVNKVETGVRVRHIPTGIIVECTEERSQLQNKKRAVKRLQAVLESNSLREKEDTINDAWGKHTSIVRGNPIRTYEGPSFKLRK